MKVERMQADQVQTYGEALKKLLHICTDISFSGEISRDFYEEKLKALRCYLQKDQACLLGAFHQGQLVGFLWGYGLPDPLGEKFHIAYLAVLPEYERQGIGSQLIREAQTQAQKMGLNRAELLVTQDNEQALAFYREQGFCVRRYILEKKFQDGKKKRDLQ